MKCDMCSFGEALWLNIKNRIWILFFTVIIMIFACEGYPYLYYHNSIPEFLFNIISPNACAGMLTGVCGVMLAMQGFSYLHYPHKVDMYHSLPVTMRQRFGFTYLTGIIIFVISIAAGIVSGIFRGTVTQNNEHAFIVSMTLRALLLVLFFLCVYHLCIYAFSLTGHPAVGLLVTGMMIIYVDLWQKVFNQSVHLVTKATFFAVESPDISIIDLYFHTTGMMTGRIPVGGELSSYIWGAAGLTLWTALSFRWAEKSYIRRPAEASKSLVILYSSRILIKVMIVVPITLLMGEAIYENFYVYPYIVQSIGMVITAYVVSFITESLISKSFKAAYHAVGSVIFALFIVFGIFSVFRLWENKYNSYIPEKEDIVDYAVYNPLDSYYYNYNIQFGDDDAAQWYIPASDYVEDNMHLSDIDAIYALAKKSLKTDSSKMKSPLPLQIYWRLNDHTSRARLIWVDMDSSENRIYLNRIMGPAYYKAGIWQGFSYDAPRDASIYSIEYHNLVKGGYTSLKSDRIGTLGIVRKWRKAMVMYDYDHVRYDEVIGEIIVYFDDGFYRWVLPVYEDMYPEIFEPEEAEEAE